MNVNQFATLMGVHVATVYRWEQKEKEIVRLDPLQANIFLVLLSKFQEWTIEERDSFSKELIEAIMIRGGLFGLFKLLKLIFD